MTTKATPVNLRILDKDYVVVCPEEEQAMLLTSAEHLKNKVQEVRGGGKVVSTERMVVVSALNITHEYFQYKQQQESNNTKINQEISRLQAKIELALSQIKI